MLMDAVTMVVNCCPFAVFSSCLSIRKRSTLCGRSWSVFVRVFTSTSKTLGLVDVFVVLSGVGAATCVTKTASCPSHVQQRCTNPHLKQQLMSFVYILAVALELANGSECKDWGTALRCLCRTTCYIASTCTVSRLICFVGSGVADRLPHEASRSNFFWKLDRKEHHTLCSAAKWV